jgi:hypothetical protein
MGQPLTDDIVTFNLTNVLISILFKLMSFSYPTLAVTSPCSLPDTPVLSPPPQYLDPPTSRWSYLPTSYGGPGKMRLSGWKNIF